MKTSARNQWTGRVLTVHLGAVTAEVLVALDGGTEVVAALSMESQKRLDLRSGLEVLVWVKASGVVLALDVEGYAISARNQIPGEVVEIRDGALSCEVILALSGAETLTAVITQESRETLGLAPGVRVMGLFAAGSVMLAVPEGTSPGLA